MKVTLPVNEAQTTVHLETELWYLLQRVLGVSRNRLGKYIAKNLVLIDKGVRSVLVSKRKKGEITVSDVEIAALCLLTASSFYKSLSRRKKMDLWGSAILGAVCCSLLLLNKHGGRRTVIPD